jgi:hypothetical protein
VAFVHGPSEVLPAADVVVPLTPSALRATIALGGTPVLLDDLIDRQGLTADRDDYVGWQLGWLSRLDDAARADGALRAAALYLMTPVDSVVIGARQLTAAIQALQPGRVTYVGPCPPPRADPMHAGHLQFWPRLGDPPVAARLLPLVAAVAGLAVAFDSGPGDAPLTAPATVARSHGLRRIAARTARRLQVLGFPKWRADGAVVLLLWASGYGAAEFAAGARRAGRRTVVLDRGRPSTRIFGPALWGARPAGPAVDVSPRPRREDPTSEWQELVGEVDLWARTPGAGDLLLSRVAAVAGRIVPVVQHAAERLRPQLQRLAVSTVAAANPSSIEEYAALLAAHRLGIERTLVQHGDHLFSYDSWLVSETQNFDVMWTSDITVPGDLKAAAERYNVGLPAFRNASPRVDGLRRRAIPVPQASTVCYVPSVLMGDSWIFRDGRYEDAWYHRWQLRLLDFMVSRPGTEFVWKALPAANQAVDPIPDELERRAAANVRYETGPLVAALQAASRVFTDFASTPLYEAVHLGRPVLAVSFTRFATLRPAAAALFAPVLRECETEEEALAAVADFLDGPAGMWMLPSAQVLPTSPREGAL